MSPPQRAISVANRQPPRGKKGCLAEINVLSRNVAGAAKI
jgi:hypothetical protein